MRVVRRCVPTKKKERNVALLNKLAGRLPRCWLIGHLASTILGEGSTLCKRDNFNVVNVIEMTHEPGVHRALTVTRGKRVPIPSDNAQILGNGKGYGRLSRRELSKGEGKVSYPLR